MARVRVSTTVDEQLLSSARGLGVDSGEIDASYAAYDDHPLDEPDEWGDLATFREAAAAS